MSLAQRRAFRGISVLALGASIVLLPATAQAQFGKMIKKKAADAVAGRAAEKVGDKQAQMNPDAKLGTPFTAASLDRVLSALEINAASWAKSDSIAKQIEPLERQLGDLNSSKGDEMNAYGEKHGVWETCRTDAQSANADAHAQERQAASDKLAAAVQNNPGKAQIMSMEWVQVQQQANAALARGDTAAAEKTLNALYKKWGVLPPSALTEAELTAKCGAQPTPPPSIATRDGLQARIDALRTKQRDAASESQEKSRAASGMSNDEFYPMSERLQMWYTIAVKGEKGARFWSDEEGALFESRRARIKKAFEQMRA